MKKSKIKLFVAVANIIVGVLAYILTRNIPFAVLAVVFTCVILFCIVIPDKVGVQTEEEKEG